MIDDMDIELRSKGHFLFRNFSEITFCFKSNFVRREKLDTPGINLLLSEFRFPLISQI